MAISSQQQTQLLQMTVGLFNAAPGTVYMNQFATMLNNGVGVVDLVKSLANSSAFINLYPVFDTNKDFATKYMNNLLGNTVSTTNKTWATNWMTSQLEAGATRGDAILSVLVALLGISPDSSDWGGAVKQFNNKIAVAEYYTMTKNGSATDLATLQGTVSNVNSDATSINQAKTQIDTLLTPVNSQTFTLTGANAH